MTGLSLDRDAIRAQFLAVVPGAIDSLGQDALISTSTPIVTRVLLDTALPSGQVGMINRKATHEATLLYRPDFPKHGGFSVTVGGVEYVPVGETVNEENFDIILTIPLVEYGVFYSDVCTLGGSSTVRLKIIARGALTLTAGSGLQDVQGSPNVSHVGFVEPGVKLHGGDVVTLPSGDSFTVVPPLQHDLLGDTVGLSWQGEQSVFPVDPDPTPDEPGTPVTSPGDDSWWNG